MDLNHLHIAVKDVAQSRHFYETFFGFRERTVHGKCLFLTMTRALILPLILITNSCKCQVGSTLAVG